MKNFVPLIIILIIVSTNCSTTEEKTKEDKSDFIFGSLINGASNFYYNYVVSTAKYVTCPFGNKGCEMAANIQIAAEGLKTANIGQEAGAKILEKVIEASSTQVIKEVAEKAGETLLEKAVEKTSTEVIKEVAEKAGETLLEKAVEKTSIEAIKEVAEKAGETLLEKAVEKTSTEAIKEVAEKAGETIMKKAIEKSTTGAIKGIAEKKAQSVVFEWGTKTGLFMCKLIPVVTSANSIRNAVKKYQDDDKLGAALYTAEAIVGWIPGISYLSLLPSVANTIKEIAEIKSEK